MTDWVRVSDSQTGAHRTTTRLELESNSNLRELKQPATDRNGRPRPPKFKTTPAGGRVSESSEPKPAAEATSTEATKEATS